MKQEKEYAPKWLYHKEMGAKLITSADEEADLGRGWVDSPAKFEEKEEAPAKKKN